ncbi:methyltransferase domain-containing protein [Microbacterium sp. CFH 90308]|uniref:Methyltransferase domain-containing protein n=1 Tax=Microbacterium salsuginis TaxID=2722803 RepID=A0ABX1KEF6_9MICO|nr:class I SAM-dependent methyltransferase [Microbacterium sp. CFH 90308]NLP84474.1 methyltransferase domain-containing protein [Microbacterium sp. CFH 90308]
MTTTLTQTSADATAAFADRMMAATLGWMDVMAIHLGSQLGWYAALEERSGSTAEELATRTRTDPRYAREWLEQQAAGGILVVEDERADAASRRFSLAPGVGEVLLDRTSLSYLEPLARMAAAAAEQLPALLHAYREGGGVSWEQLGIHAREAQADMNRPWFEQLPRVFGGVERIHTVLRRPGARIADIGAGAGWSAISLAQSYPQLQVVGFDIDEASVEAARVNAAEAGVSDRVVFLLADAALLAEHGPFDGVFAFECLHDMPHPVEVLAAAKAAVAEGGVVVVMDEAAADRFAPDASDLERLLYGFSLFVCLPDGMSHRPSAATGTVMRPDTLREYARAAGWTDIDILVPEFGLWRFYEIV